jgi:hypothetical protein
VPPIGRLAKPSRRAVLGLMPKAWKIIALTERDGGGPPLKKYFLVAIPDQFAAMAALRTRRHVSATVELIVIGEATPDYVDWLDIRGGEILCVVAAS